jgi:hypothetical protein
LNNSLGLVPSSYRQFLNQGAVGPTTNIIVM